MPNPIVFVHGYSDKGSSWGPWRTILKSRLEMTEEDLRVCTYVSLTNEVTIKDIAEAFDRALGLQSGVAPDQPFDAFVHSTGMLVLRAWLAVDPRRVKRLKRLVALAPATFGSPLAQQGRSWLGAIFKGNKHLGPDFLEAGDRVLDSLELASTFIWQLAESDILSEPARYSNGPETPWVFVFCGTGVYRGLRSAVNKPGTDGTVRHAGCGMNTRLIELDMTEGGTVARRRNPALVQRPALHAADRILVEKWLNDSIPVHLIGEGEDGPNHATILSDPPTELQALVLDALQMTDPDSVPDPASGYSAWLARANAQSRASRLQEQWQQFIVHAVDERGDPVTDYFVELSRVERGRETRIEAFDAEVDVYSSDRSYRCFHMDVSQLLAQEGEDPPGLSIRLVASSGTAYVGYIGYGFEQQTEAGSWDARLSFDGGALKSADFFRPYSTTLIRLYIERQVLPPERDKPCSLLVWQPPEGQMVFRGGQFHADWSPA